MCWEKRESEKEVNQKGKFTEEMGREGREEKKDEEDNAAMKKNLVEARTTRELTKSWIQKKARGPRWWLEARRKIGYQAESCSSAGWHHAKGNQR